MSAPTLARAVVPPDPDAPADARRCPGCLYPLVSSTYPGNVPAGWRRHHGRGICINCRRRAAAAGALDDIERPSRTRDEVLDEVVRLREDGVTRYDQLAARIGITVEALRQHVSRARRAGDPRAA